MKPARELLRKYVARRRAESQPPTLASSQEENLRRLLRHVGAAHQPSAQLETRLLDAMCRTARETPSRPDAHQRWPWLALPAWRFGVPAAAGALVLLALLWPRFSQAPGQERVAVAPTPGSTTRDPGHLPQATDSGARTSTPEPLPIGYVLLPQGDLLRRASRDTEWKPVEGGDPIYLGDAMRTEPDSMGSVVFEDGSDCQFAAATTLQVDGDARAGLKRPARVQLTRGQLWVRVEKGGPEFRVVAPAGAAIVQGTVFSVSVDGKGATRLQVTEGKVRLQNAWGTVLVRAGSESVALVGGAPQPPFPIRRVLKPEPQEATAQPGDPAARRPLPSTQDSRRTGGSDGAAGKPKRLPTIESFDPRSRPLRKPAPKEEPEEPHSAPINSSGTPSEPETRLPITTSGP